MYRIKTIVLTILCFFISHAGAGTERLHIISSIEEGNYLRTGVGSVVNDLFYSLPLIGDSVWLIQPWRYFIDSAKHLNDDKKNQQYDITYKYIVKEDLPNRKIIRVRPFDQYNKLFFEGFNNEIDLSDQQKKRVCK